MGIDSDPFLQYWTVANNWGNDWGMQGYFNIIRGVNNCGIELGPDTCPIAAFM
jgi:hypothetical protein